MEENNLAPLPGSSRTAIIVYLAISAVVYVLMMVFGLAMRAGQATWIDLDPGLFYKIMTAHGAGMVGISGLAASAIFWYFLRQHVKLTTSVLWVNLFFFLIGVVMILSGIFLFGFAGGWTFLFPLPSHGMGLWGTTGAALFLGGLLLIGVGFLIFYLDVTRAILAKYGSLAKGLGWPQLFFGSKAEMPPAPIVAGTMVLIVNIAGIVAGAVVLVLMLINLFVPSFAIDALFTKNLIYFFGHVFINATIYQSVIAVYELLPKYAKRPWKVNRVFLAAWTAATIMVMFVYPHHLLMDFVMPKWMLIMGQIMSYTSGIPVLLVTSYGACTIIFRSGMKWDVISGLLFLSMFGWATGVIPAIIDATIIVNNVMHNTLWVPGHFHFYLIVGLLSMVFGFMYHFTNQNYKVTVLDKLGFWLFTFSGTGFAMSFLLSGQASIPRRWAVHLPEWVGYSQFAAVLGACVALSAVIFSIRFIGSLKNARTA